MYLTKKNIGTKEVESDLPRFYSRTQVVVGGGVREMAQQLEPWLLPKGPSSSSSNHMEFTTIWNSSLRGSNTVFSPLRYQTHSIHTYCDNILIHLK